jgi:hypothetical protein
MLTKGSFQISESIFVRVGLYHGTEALCQVLETKQIIYTTNHNLRWDEWLEFDISQPDLPQAAKLCLSICSIKKRKNRCDTTMLFWFVHFSVAFKRLLACTIKKLIIMSDACCINVV